MSKKCSHTIEFQLIAPYVIIDNQSQVKRNMIFKYKLPAGLGGWP